MNFYPMNSLINAVAYKQQFDKQLNFKTLE